MFGAVKVRLSLTEKQIIVRRTARSMFGELTVSNLVFYVQSISAVISVRYTFCYHTLICKSVYMLYIYIYNFKSIRKGE